MKAAGYGRVSTEEQTEGFSLDAQDDRIRKHCDYNEWELYEMYVDPGKSGKDLRRDDIQRLLKDLQGKKFQAVVVHKLDRLTRNIGDLYYLLNLFDQYEIKFVSISENLDTSTAMGRMFVFMLGIMAQWVRENIAEETRKGQSTRAMQGFRSSPSRPYGYQVGENLSLTVDEDERPTVTQIYEWYLKGMGTTKIARELNVKGIPSPRGVKWNYLSIINILSSPTYLGYHHWKAKNAPESQRIISKGDHEPLVSEDIYNQVQEMMKRRSTGDMVKSSYDFYFSTILKCGVCGRPFHGKIWQRGQQKAKRYLCSGKKKYGECKASEVSEYRVAELVFAEMDAYVHKSFDASQKLEQPKQSIDTDKERKRIEREIAKCREVMKTLVDLLSSGRIDDEVYDEKRSEQSAKIEELRFQLVELPEEQRTMKISRSEAIKIIKQMRENWPYLEESERKMFMQRFFSKIEIAKVNGEWKLKDLVSTLT